MYTSEYIVTYYVKEWPVAKKAWAIGKILSTWS